MIENNECLTYVLPIFDQYRTLGVDTSRLDDHGYEQCDALAVPVASEPLLFDHLRSLLLIAG